MRCRFVNRRQDGFGRVCKCDCELSGLGPWRYHLRAVFGEERGCVSFYFHGGVARIAIDTPTESERH